MKLAIFADDTWNRIEAGGSGTNVVNLSRMTVHDAARRQFVKYDEGVSTNIRDKLLGRHVRSRGSRRTSRSVTHF